MEKSWSLKLLPVKRLVNLTIMVLSILGLTYLSLGMEYRTIDPFDNLEKKRSQMSRQFTPLS